MVSDRYHLRQSIGSGGMSEVYEADDSVLGRTVAVKMLRPDMARDVNFRERFRREAQNSGKLNHPNIVAVFDTGEKDVDGLHPVNMGRLALGMPGMVACTPAGIERPDPADESEG